MIDTVDPVVTIKMSRTEKGSTDGIHLRSYKKDGIYDIPHELAMTFIHDMECAEEHTRVETPESKMEKLETPESKNGGKNV